MRKTIGVVLGFLVGLVFVMGAAQTRPGRGAGGDDAEKKDHDTGDHDTGTVLVYTHAYIPVMGIHGVRHATRMPCVGIVQPQKTRIRNRF